MIYKERVKKAYRHPQLEERLTSRRVLQVKFRRLNCIFNLYIKEVRCMVKARRSGVRTPAVYSIDLVQGRFIMELVNGITLKEAVSKSTGDSDALKKIGETVGSLLARLHNVDIIHGDLTTSNFLVESATKDIILIDFGLASGSNLIEDKAVDLYVLERAIASTHSECSKELFSIILEAYGKAVRGSKNILTKLADVQLRGRKREMIG